MPSTAPLSQPEPAPPAAATAAVEPFSAVGTQQPAEGEQPAQAAGLAAIERVCEWCGTANPAGAERCMRCNAHFPRPEQDALLTRVSQERLRLALSEIEMHERMRTPWWKKLFPTKKEEAR
jgi:ribosomal protein L40E